jgi:hypothetical protein
LVYSSSDFGADPDSGLALASWGFGLLGVKAVKKWPRIPELVNIRKRLRKGFLFGENTNARSSIGESQDLLATKWLQIIAQGFSPGLRATQSALKVAAEARL